MKTDLHWISGPWQGRLAIAMRPRGGDWLDEEAQAWSRAGVDTIVSLLDEKESAAFDLSLERSEVETHRIQFVAFPIPDRGVPETTPSAHSLVSKLRTELENGRTVAIHCRQGIGRSAMIAAGVLVASGLSSNEAIERVSAARGVITPETADQMRWIAQMAAQPLHSS